MSRAWSIRVYMNNCCLISIMPITWSNYLNQTYKKIIDFVFDEYILICYFYDSPRGHWLLVECLNKEFGQIYESCWCQGSLNGTIAMFFLVKSARPMLNFWRQQNKNVSVRKMNKLYRWKQNVKSISIWKCTIKFQTFVESMSIQYQKFSEVNKQVALFVKIVYVWFPHTLRINHIIHLSDMSTTIYQTLKWTILVPSYI